MRPEPILPMLLRLLLACSPGAAAAPLDDVPVFAAAPAAAPSAEDARDDALFFAIGPPISPLSFGADAISQSFTCRCRDEGSRQDTTALPPVQIPQWRVERGSAAIRSG